MPKIITLTKAIDGINFALSVRRDGTGVISVSVSCDEHTSLDGQIVGTPPRLDIPIPAAVRAAIETRFAELETAIRARDYA